MIGHQTALIYLMVLVSASDREMTDAELHAIGDMVKRLPIFEGYDQEALAGAAQNCAELLAQTDGPERVFELITESLPDQVRETAYALACDVAAADGQASQEELRMLETVRDRLGVGRLEAAAIERGTRARYTTL
jgi:tellurite resistance protein